MKRNALAALALALATVAPTYPQLPELVADLSPGTSRSSAFIHSFEAVGDRALFVVEQAARVLYSSDGTAGGTVQLPASGEVVARAGDSVLLLGDQGLWRTDGTVAGTWQVAPPSVAVAGALPRNGSATLDNGITLVIARRGVGGGVGVLATRGGPGDASFLSLGLSSFVSEIYAAGPLAFVTTSGGEIAVTAGLGGNVLASTNDPIRSFRVSGARLFYVTGTNSGSELWVADAVANESRRIARLSGGGFGAAQLLAGSDAGVVLSAGAGSTQQLYFSDGRSVEQLTTLPQGTALAAAHLLGNEVIFAAPGSASGWSLWRASLGQLGQTLLGDVERVTVPARFDAFRGGVFLSSASGSLVWTDGSPGGTASLAPSADGLSLAHGRAIFVSASRLFESDGTVAGTRRIAGDDLFRVDNTNAALAPYAAALPSGAVFAAGRFGDASAVWATDGDPSTVRRVVESPPSGDDSRLEDLRTDGEVAYFLQGTWSLWIADASGARQLFAEGASPCAFEQIRLNDVLDGRALIECRTSTGEGALWSVDDQGDAELLANLQSSSGTSGGYTRLGSDAVVGRGDTVYLTDGTAAGTRAVFSQPGEFVGVAATTETHIYVRVFGDPGSDLFRVDRTGASELRARLPSQAGQLVVADDGAVYFIDGFEFELGKVDVGSTSARRLNVPSLWSEEILVPYGNRVLYLGLGGGGQNLFATDGSNSTPLGQGTDFPTIPQVVGSRVFFLSPSAENRDLLRLLVSDGTSPGTDLGARVEDLLPGSIEMASAGGRVYLTADAPDLGRELWVSDGTVPGTRLVADLHPGRESSHPQQLAAAADRLFFVADDGLRGAELYRLSTTGPPCRPGATVSCLNGNRFRVEMTWMDFQGQTGVGQAQELTDDTAYAWFFDPDNVEIVLKVLDGTPINGNFWVFSGALSDVFYTITVTDSATGRAKRYLNPRGNFGSFGDVTALGANGHAGVVRLDASPGSGFVSRIREPRSCAQDARTHCLNEGRFEVRVSWRTSQGTSGDGNAAPLTGDTGSFWFFHPDNVELVVKVLDATAINGSYWVFYGSLSDVEYDLTITDTVTGAVKTYRNEQGTFASVGDTSAFD